MSKISTESVKAFMNRSTFYRANTIVTVDNSGTSHLILHGNEIVKRTVDGRLYICDSGWRTKLTAERLNAIPGVNLKTKEGEWLLNDKEWDGSLTLVE